MADSFFGFDTSVSNLNDDDGGGGDGSEEEYDALNDETFGQADAYDWESQHEQVAAQMESSRRGQGIDDSHSQLEASLSQLVLDEPDAPHSSTLNSSKVWQHDAPFGYVPPQRQPQLKNVLSVEELERQLRQKQPPPPQHANYFQPRFPPVILQRPPGLQGPVPPPFAQPQHGQPQMGAPLGQPQMGFDGPPMGGSAMGQAGNQMGGRVNQFFPQQNNLQNGQFNPNFQHMNMLGQRMLGPPPGMGPRPAPPQPTLNHGYRPPTKMDQQVNHNMYNQQMMPQMQNQQQLLPNQQLPQQQILPNQQLQSQQLRQKQTSPNQKSQKHNQKNRIVYNNNIVQLIKRVQNTHPMFQMNNLNNYNNANHHPMLNIDWVYNQPMNQMMMYNRQPNGNANGNNNNNNRLNMTNGDDPPSPADRPEDEYAGLMTSREKQWLLNIQMLQLNTGTPYIDDFYYTVFLERQSRKEKEGIKEAHKANQQNHPFYSGNVKQEQNHRERHNSNRHNSQSEEVTPRTYVPTQFENSLGRLQCGSVTAPRKIIDVELVQGEAQAQSRPASRASTANHSEYPREVRRTKQILLDIEALYLILLRLEELNEPLAISNALILKEREEKQKLLESTQKELEQPPDEGNLFLRNIEAVHRKSRSDCNKTEVVDKRQVVNLTVSQNPTLTAKNLLDENKDDLINKMFAGLLYEDRLQQFLMVRKGKALVSRFLSRAPRSHARLRALWSRALRALNAAARRDAPALTPLATHYAEYIHASTGWPAVLESCSLLAEAFDPARTPYALTAPFTISCICALIEKVTTLINTPVASSNERLWTKFLKTFARAAKNTTLTVARPLKPLTENKLLYHIKQIESRSVIEILQRGKTAEFDLSKTEFSDLLLSHLC